MHTPPPLALLSRADTTTRAIGHALGRAFADGSPTLLVLTLEGELGTGKTQLCKGIVGGLDGDAAEVVSPTFTLLNIYAIPSGEVHHLDCYRLTDSSDAFDVGIEGSLEMPTSGRRIVLVEWPGKVPGLLPDTPDPATTRTIELAHVDATTRRLILSGFTAAERRAVQQAFAGNACD